MKRTLALILASLLAAGCGVFESKKIDYKSASKAPATTLAVPPDLVAPTGDNRFVVPDAGGGSATYSAYNRERKDPVKTQGSAILPDVDKVHIERAGSQRWLTVNVPAEQVWTVTRDFWQEQGFIVNLESKETGVMETDWAENRAKIPQDFIRSSIGKVLDGLYSTSERDKFRTRVERNAAGATEIYISHRGMYEVLEGGDGGQRTIWQPRPSDPELEAEMLRRLMTRFGVQEERAKTLVAEQAAPERAQLVRSASGQQELVMDEGFDRAWRRVGLALDRVGFAVEDRDRSQGIYYVRYIDPDADNANKKDTGFFSSLAFWKSDKPAQQPTFQIQVRDEGAATRVRVAQAEGKDAAQTEARIMSLLHKELR
jgi:outer membrane protein assembly factor BamC